jgi:hypothetical protein
MNRRIVITFPLFRVFGAALAVAAADPPDGFMGTSSPQIALLLGLFALWAAAPVVRRPVLTVHRWLNLLARHRNTVFAGACTVVAAAGRPALWLMIADAALLLGYLLALDSVAAGPIGGRQLRSGWPAGLAAAATALVLALVRLTSDAQSSVLAEGGRWLASVGALLAGGALALAFLPRRAPAEQAAARPKAPGAAGSAGSAGSVGSAGSPGSAGSANQGAGAAGAAGAAGRPSRSKTTL